MARIQNQYIRRFVHTGVLAGALACAGLWPGSAAAQAEAAEPSDAAKTFVDTLYAERIDKAQRTRDSEDDLALMSEMLDIAPTLPTEPDARSALYVRIVQMLDRSRAGHGLALKALAELSKHNPNHPSAGPKARLEVYGLWYREADRSERSEIAEQYFDQLVVAADEAVRRADHANAKQWYGEAASVQRVARVESDIDLRERLVAARKVEKIDEEISFLQGEAAKGELKTEQARRLIVLMTLELGRYEQAGAYTSFVKDDTFVKGFRSAAAIGGKQINDQSADHPPGTWLKAGNWYTELIDEPGLRDQSNKLALVLARTALRKYIDITSQEDIHKARAAIQLRQLDQQWEEKYAADEEGSGKGEGKNLLAFLDPAKHMIAGKPFTVEDGHITLPPKSILCIPFECGDSYVLSLTVRANGMDNEDNLAIWLPVAGRTARLFIDSASHRRAKVDGLNYIEDSEKTMLLKPDEASDIRLEVASFDDGQAAFRLYFNGEKTWSWRGRADKFEDPGYGKPENPKHLAIRGTANLFIEKVSVENKDDEEE